MINRISRSLFALAKWRDERRRRHVSEQQYGAVARLWTERAGISSEQAAVGINPDAPIPAVLLGLRIGSCRLDIPCDVVGLDAIATVSHDVARGSNLRVVVRPRVPFRSTGWSASPSMADKVRQIEASTGPQWVLDDLLIEQLWHDDDLEPWLMGTTSLVEQGDRHAEARHWTAHVLGAFAPGDRWDGVLVDVAVSMSVYPSDPTRSGLAAHRNNPRLRALRPVVEWSTWRRDSIVPDVARLMRVRLEFPEAVTSGVAEDYLLDNVCRLLHLYTGGRPTTCGLWDPQEQTGRLIDLGRPLISGHRPVVQNSVVLGPFMRETAPVWGSLTDAERKNIKIGMDSLAAMSPDLEPAVVAGAMTLEFLCAAFLPKAVNRYALNKVQRDEIMAGLTQLASAVAGGTEWERNLARIASRLWSAPAEDRISELASTFGIQADADELRAYIEVRNAITHGRPSKASLADKVTAMHFQLHAGGVILLRKVGFTGPVRDARRHKLRSPEPSRG